MFFNLFAQNVYSLSTTPSTEQTILSVDIHKARTLKVGEISGYDKDFPLSISYDYVPGTNECIVVGYSTHGWAFRSLVGKRFANISLLEKACKKLL